MVKLKELVDGLSVILKEHPELADAEVYHASECGYSSAGFESPVSVAVPVYTPEFKDSGICVRIVSDDDGYRTNGAFAGWKFISSEEKQDGKNCL